MKRQTQTPPPHPSGPRRASALSRVSAHCSLIIPSTAKPAGESGRDGHNPSCAQRRLPLRRGEPGTAPPASASSSSRPRPREAAVTGPTHRRPRAPVGTPSRPPPGRLGAGTAPPAGRGCVSGRGKRPGEGGGQSPSPPAPPRPPLPSSAQSRPRPP